MSTSVLVGFATSYGSTQEVAEAVAATLRFPINLLDGDLRLGQQPGREA